MFSKFDSLSNLPKPFELFTQKKDKNGSDESGDGSSDKTSTPIREGLTVQELVKDPKKTDDIQSGQSQLIIFLIVVFIILFVIIGLIYYFNSNLLMIKQLMAKLYTKDDFWQLFKGNMVASKVTVFGILWMVVFCVNLLLMDSVFQNHEYDNIFYVTTIFYWSIVGSTMLLIGNIPSLVDVFENTIGYSVLNSPLFNLKRTMSMFKNRNFRSDTLNISYDFLITTFNIPSFHDYFTELCDQYPTNKEYFGEEKVDIKDTDKPKSDFYIDLNTWMVTDEEQLKTLRSKPGRIDTNKTFDSPESLYARKELLKCVLTKNTIGHFIWILLSSYTTILLTINTIIQ